MAQKKPDNQHGEGKAKILVVDDHPLVRQGIEGFKVNMIAHSSPHNDEI